MSVSVTMPRLGESVSEGTVTRWLKNEGDRVEADEPLLEVSTDKVDTEIPAPASGVLSSIKVGEDETVEVGAELATIDDGSGGDSGQAAAPADEQAQQAPPEQEQAPQEQAPQGQAQQAPPEQEQAPQEQAPQEQAPQEQAPQAPQEQAPQAPQEQGPQEQEPQEQAQQAPPQQEQAQQAQAQQAPPQQKQAQQPQAQEAPPQQPPPQERPQQPEAPAAQAPSQEPSTSSAQADLPPLPATFTDDDQGAYVTPLVRKLAAEHGVDLTTLNGTGVGGRIRKQDVLEAARSTPPPATEQPAADQSSAPAEQRAEGGPAPAAASAASSAAAALRGRTVKMSRLRTVIAERMVESLQTSAQLTTVVEADVTKIARLRQRAKNTFEATEGVKLSFLPFFALATVEALKAHPNVNASIDDKQGTITYHDAEHLGIAVDTDRGLLAPVIHDAGDLNLGGLARKIADLAERTRAGKVSPDELSGGTFTLTNTGSRGALFDTPIINQPQVGILGTGSVVKRAVVVDDPDLGEIVTVRSMVYLALTYDHRLVDGADAARFLGTIRERLEGGRFEAALGL
ncbi:MAG: 2-oxoglutarate dehydrogenase, E2 component, dihydrolipoamide succinyltransferase [Actinomycetota bacterium]|nr:2-oxoglutarate dehydrogenase, E2 component, dihydrolipoamide succinyltransferase [Actinomycetota bacterium]